MTSPKIWFITLDQIAAMDVDSAILRVDPAQIAGDEVFGLCGAVRLRIEGAQGMADVIANPASRKFFRALHARWPWAAYYLRLHSLNAKSTPNQILDIAVFVALILVQVDDLALAETPQGIGLRYDARQFSGHLFELQVRAAQLAVAVDLPPTFIAQRETLVFQAIANFFRAGQTLHTPSSRKRKKKQ